MKSLSNSSSNKVAKRKAFFIELQTEDLKINTKGDLEISIINSPTRKK